MWSASAQDAQKTAGLVGRKSGEEVVQLFLGVPKIFSPCGLHLRPKLLHSGWAYAFSVPHPCLPACKWILALVESSSPRMLHPGRVRSGSDMMNTSSLLPSSWPLTERREFRLKRRGIRGSPCSPPSHCTMSCKFPESSRQVQCDSSEYMALTNGRRPCTAHGRSGAGVSWSSYHVPHAFCACPR